MDEIKLLIVDTLCIGMQTPTTGVQAIPLLQVSPFLCDTLEHVEHLQSDSGPRGELCLAGMASEGQGDTEGCFK